MSNKPEIVFTFPACLGGVASFNFNVINHSKLIGKFHSTVILLKADDDSRPVFKESFLADRVVTFHYSPKENKQYLLKRLNNLLGNKEGAIVTDNSLTIEAAAFCKNSKTVFSLIHDYFYVNQNVNLGDLADVAIAHSSFFSDAVFASNPILFSNRSMFIPYGVKQRTAFPEKNNRVLNLVFLGRLVEEKGVKLLHAINDRLIKENITVHWTIIGQGPLKSYLTEQWKNQTNISFYEPGTTAEIYSLLGGQDLFIFPTMFEGTPVSIFECMANGVVTIANDLPGGIRDLVTEVIGFKCDLNDIKQFTEKIKWCYENPKALLEMQKACFALSNDQYDIENNADNYFLKFLDYEKYKRFNKAGKAKFSRLDKAYLPTGLVKKIRSIT